MALQPANLILPKGPHALAPAPTPAPAPAPQPQPHNRSPGPTTPAPQPQPHPHNRSPGPTTAPYPQPGARGRVVGLVSGAQYNARVGKVVDYDGAAGRYLVQLDAEHQLRLKLGNLLCAL